MGDTYDVFILGQTQYRSYNNLSVWAYMVWAGGPGGATSTRNIHTVDDVTSSSLSISTEELPVCL